MSWPQPQNRPISYSHLGVRIFPDGREVCLNNAEGKRLYQRRKKAMYDRQSGLCSLCGTWMRLEEATFQHGVPRGMGAGFRDDRIDVQTGEGEYVNSVAHGSCNGQQGSRRQFQQHFDAQVEDLA